MEKDKFRINKFRLPKSIVNRINTKTWKEPEDKNYLRELVIKECPFENEVEYIDEMINGFTLYSLELIRNESECLYKWLEPEWDDSKIMLLGKKDEKIPPGDIDTEKIILFADFGHGSDTPFGLDYRASKKTPTVVLLYWGENCNTDNRWKKIANSFEEFERIVWKENVNVKSNNND